MATKDNTTISEYFRTTKKRPLTLLVKAVLLLGYKGTALDLGCSAVRDTRFLIM